MTNSEYELLQCLEENGGKLPLTIAADFPQEKKFAMQQLIRSRLVIYTDGIPDGMGGVKDYAAIAISDKGKQTLFSESSLRKQMADQEARKSEQKKAYDAQTFLDKKKARRHDYKVAAFSVALTLIAEHVLDIVDFFKLLFERILFLFQ